jgi:hypothetical protein
VNQDEESQFKLLSVGEAGRQRAAECAEIVGERFLRSLRLIYGVGERDQPVALGTSLLLRHRGVPYLVTAAHVLDDANITTLYVTALPTEHGPGALITVTGTFVVSKAPEGRRSKDRLDFAFRRLEPAEAARLDLDCFIDSADVSENRGTTSGRQYIVMGYPASRNKRVNVQAKTVDQAAWTFQGTYLDDPKFAEHLGVSGAQHIFLEHGKKVGNYEGGIESPVSPKGASGGAVIDLGIPDPAKLASDAPCTGRLAGWFIEFHKAEKRLVGVKIQVLLEAMDANPL